MAHSKRRVMVNQVGWYLLWIVVAFSFYMLGLGLWETKGNFWLTTFCGFLCFQFMVLSTCAGVVNAINIWQELDPSEYHDEIH